MVHTKRARGRTLAASCVLAAAASGVIPVSAQSPPRWTLGAPTARVGDAKDRDAIELTGLRGIVPLRDEGIALSDSKLPSALVFDSLGRLRHRLGGQGRGPGEFVAIGPVGRLGDTVWVADVQRGLSNLYLPDGRFIAQLPRPHTRSQFRPGTTRSVAPSGLLTNRRMITTVSVSGRPDGAPPPPRHGNLARLVLVDTLGVQRDTIRWIGEGAWIFEPGYLPVLGYPFAEVPLWRVAPDGSGFVLVDRPVATSAARSSYRVTRHGVDGRVVWRTDVAYTPLPTPQRLVDSIVTAFAAAIDSVDHPRNARAIARDSLGAPAFLPPVTAALIGADGSVWVGREGFSATRGYDVIDAGGRLVGSITLPRRVELQAATARAIWVVERDADDVPTVVRYPVIRR